MKAWAQMTKHMRSGRSWSGGERNCCFLNTRGVRFADVSAATGLDLIDDGRAVATVDWDHDGDEDVWLLNRTGPQVRFLRNDVPSENHYVALRLVGDGKITNRDAIGARVEVVLRQSRVQTQESIARKGNIASASGLSTLDSRSLIKTLVAGDSYLSQSSKWLHFGLGPEPEIERIVVRWPGGESELFTDLESDRRYVIVQGSGHAKLWKPPRGRIKLRRSQPVSPKPSAQARIVFLRPSSTINMKFSGPDGALHELPQGPVLLNLWSTTCQPCIEELRLMGARRNDLLAAGVTVFALNVDKAVGDESFGYAQARRRLKDLGFSFPAAVASSTLLDQLQAVADNLFYLQSQLPLPTSFLLDAQRQVSVVYKGPVDIEKLISDTRALARRPARVQDTSGTFPGRWTLDLFNYDVRSLANFYTQIGSAMDGIAFLRSIIRADRRPSSPARDRSQAEAYLMLGELCMRTGRIEDAASALEQARRLTPENPRTLVVLARLRVAQGRDEEADNHLVVALRRRPDDSAALTELGLIRARHGKAASAIELYQKAIDADPGHWQAVKNLAWIRATHPDPKLRQGGEAVRLSQQACRATGYGNPEVLDTLAAAQAEVGQFEAAVDTVDKALLLLRGGDTEALEAIRQRKQLYRAGRSYHDASFGQ